MKQRSRSSTDNKIMSKSLNEVDRFNAMIALFPFIITPRLQRAEDKDAWPGPTILAAISGKESFGAVESTSGCLRI